MTCERPRILAIDDNPENLVTLATALEADFDFQLAASGPRGLALADATPPDLILLDVMMPEVDGFETCRRFKNNTRLADIPIIFLTAMSDMGTEISGLALGAVDYITKPINVQLVRQRMHNILQLTLLTRELKASEERLRLVMDATGDGIWDWLIADGNVRHNLSWCRILGLNERYLSHPLATFIERIHPEDLPAVKQTLDTCLAGGAPYVSEHRLLHNSGNYVWVSDRGRVVERNADGSPARMVGCVKNIDERKQHEAEIHQLAFFDTLTGLPNRRLLQDRLQQSFIRNQRNGTRSALMFLDMDRFKLLNDTHGHAMGDALLVEVARRLQAGIRKQDTVARLGGDEFVVMLEGLSGQLEEAQSTALVVGRKLLDALNLPYYLRGLDYRSTPSIGLTIFAGDSTGPDEAMRQADIAMYRAKAAGRNTLKLYSEETNLVDATSITT
jgi:diguanylate cyclase (GGDEF)-like protein/PAS domain S-box-containing protein